MISLRRTPAPYAPSKHLSPTSSANKQRLYSLHDGNIRLGPQTLHIDVTNTCNTDCVTCWDHSPHLDQARPTVWKRQRADAQALAALLDDVQSLGGLEAVIVSGMGEPFTHPQIYEILADVKKRGLHLTVITNLVAADPQKIIDLGVDALLIGVQGASEASYLAFHPSFNADHWQKLHRILQQFNDAGRDLKHSDKHVQVICTHNAHELVQMIELADQYNAAQVNFKLASLRLGTEKVRIMPEQRQHLLDVGIPQARQRAEELAVTHNLDVFTEQVQIGGEATAPIEDVGCFLGYHYSRITVEGTVLFCCNTEVVVGQLDDKTRFSDLWRGESWQAWRRKMRAGDFLESCHQCGKINQNVKLSQKFRTQFGDAAWHDAKGTFAPQVAEIAPHTPSRKHLPVLS